MCVPKNIGCPIRELKIVKKTDKIKKYIQKYKNKFNSETPNEFAK